ncbi:hypothetical protein [Micromonospora sp. NPDC049645]|uniref:hypothetical protein n=1 Tax=Micromonospora sp. NPDC049645 TaxID=3155508 RepID=UPI00341757F0
MTHRPPIALSSGRDPWEQQPAESDLMYSRFRTYLELGRARTLTQVAEILTTLGDPATRSTAARVYIRSLSARYRWVERCGAFDREQSRIEAERLVEQRRDLIQRYRSISGSLVTKAKAGLEKLKDDDLSALDVVRFFKIAFQIESTALGMPVDTVAVTGPGGGPMLVDDLGRLTPEERRQRLAQLAAEVGRRAAAPPDSDDEDEA